MGEGGLTYEGVMTLTIWVKSLKWQGRITSKGGLNIWRGEQKGPKNREGENCFQRGPKNREGEYDHLSLECAIEGGHNDGLALIRHQLTELDNVRELEREKGAWSQPAHSTAA